MIGHLVRPADFERVLGTPSRARSRHFAVHFLAARPASRRASQVVPGLSTELSTDGVPVGVGPVDDSLPHGRWLGLVVPKRHARRAATRNLLKRQIRQAMGVVHDRLPEGLWVVRLRSPFEREQFPSAASVALRQAAGAELGTLLTQAAAAVGRAAKG